jgi:hypothetical protein
MLKELILVDDLYPDSGPFSCRSERGATHADLADLHQVYEQLLHLFSPKLRCNDREIRERFFLDL